MKRPKEPEPELAGTLSRRVSQLRESRNLTIIDLARSCRFPVKRIEEIESGIEVWLSVTDRSILSRALGVQPAVLKEVEAGPEDIQISSYGQPENDTDFLAKEVLARLPNLACPRCGAILITSIESALDFEGLPTHFARAYCPVCPFALH